MQPESNQSARLHETNKTNNFETLEDITIVNLKFRPYLSFMRLERLRQFV